MVYFFKGHPECDNSVFENLNELYQIKTKYGIYQKTPDHCEETTNDDGEVVTMAPMCFSYIDFTIEAGDLAEISCANLPGVPRLPRTDLRDDDHKDDTITTFCMAPTTPTGKGRYVN